MNSKIDKQGRIYIQKIDKGVFPEHGVILVDNIKASVNTTSNGRSFICGLKGYVEVGTPINITHKTDNEYSLEVVGNPNNGKQTDEKRGIQTVSFEIDTYRAPSKTEDLAVRIFEEYIGGFPDRFKAIKTVGDIRRYKDGYEGVYADYVVFDTEKNEKVFFEIKGTSKTDHYWGGVTLKELESAVRKGDNYRFAIICTDSRRDDPFIYPQRNNPKDPYAVFMTLKDLLRFTTRASMGIQFTIKYSSNNSRLETTLQGKKAYSENDLMQLLEIYAKLKDAKLAR